MLYTRLAKLLRALPVKSTRNHLNSPQSAFFENLESRVLMAFDPTAQEQYTLELINDMRMNPAAHISRFISSFSPLTATDKNIQIALDQFKTSGSQLAKEWATLVATTPLAWNEALTKAAIGHTDYLVANDQQEHNFPGEPDLAGRANDAGYTPFHFLGENLYNYAIDPFYGHAGFIIDWGDTPTGIQTPAGHRDTMMSPHYKEVGVHIRLDNDPDTKNGPMLITEEFGDRFSLVNPYFLGTLYDDLNANGYYEPGEGLSGITVTMKSATNTFTTTSMTAGGYQLNVPAGTYTVTYSGGKFANPITRTNVVIGSDNVHENATLQELSPHIVINGNGNKISNNDTTPSVTDGTHVANASPNAPTTYTFTIQNTGTQNLTLTNPIVTAGSSFKLTSTPSLTIAPGNSSNFTIDFMPTVSGTFSTIFSVSTNDSTASTYKFTLSATTVVPQPNISITGNGVQIADGDTTPSATDGTLVSIPFNGPTGIANIQTFQLTNTGDAKLQITGSSLSGGYKLQTSLPAFVDIGQSITIAVSFTPTVGGVSNGTIAILTNDPDTDSYNFALQSKTVAANPTFTAEAAKLAQSSAILGVTMFDVSVKLINTGSVLVNGATVDFYLSKDAAFSTTDIRLNTLSSAAQLLPGQEITLSASVKTSTTIAPGTYFLIAKTKSGATIVTSPASDTTIDILPVPLLPDLTISGSITGAVFTPGDQVKSTLAAKNLGPGMVEASSITAVLSKDKIFGNEDDILLGNFTTTALKSGTSFALASNALTIPEVADGTYFILAKADADNLIIEKSETNNLYTSAAFKVQHPVLGIKATTTKFSEGAGSTTFTLTRTGGSTLRPVTALLDITGAAFQNADYQLMVDKTIIPGNTIVIPAGKSSVTVKLVGLEDAIVEPTEDIQISLLADPNPDSFYVVNGAQANIAFTLEDNEPSITLKASSTKTTETKGFITYTVTRKTTSLAAPLTVFFAASGTAEQGTDYTFTSIDGKTVFTNSFTIPAKSASFTFKASVNDDTLVEIPETVDITLLENPDTKTYSLGSPISASFVIEDNEPSVSIKASAAKTTESNGFITYTVTRKTASLVNPLTVFFNASGTATQGVDYRFTTADGKTVLTDSFTIPAKSGTFTFKAQVIDDTTVESSEDVTVTLIEDPGVIPAYSLGTPVSGSFSITDDEPTINVTVPATGTKEGALAALPFTFTRASGSNAAEAKISFKITGTAAFANDYSLLAGTKGSTVTFTESAGEVVGTITIPAKVASAILNLRAAKDADNDEPTESVILTLDSSTQYNVGAKNTATGSILDVDVKLPIADAVSPLQNLGARLTFSTAVTKTERISLEGVAGLVNRATVTGELFSTDNWIGTYSYQSFSAGPDANKVIFTLIGKSGSADLAAVRLTLTFNSVTTRPINLLGKQISFYADGTANTDGTFSVTGLPGDPDAIFTGTFSI